METESRTKLEQRIKAACGNIDTPEGLTYFESLAKKRGDGLFPGLDIMSKRVEEIRKSRVDFQASLLRINYMRERRAIRRERLSGIWKIFKIW